MWWLPAVSLLLVGFVAYVGSALHVLNFSPFVAQQQESARADAVRTALEEQKAMGVARVSRNAPTVQLQAAERPDAEPRDVPVPPSALAPNRRAGRGADMAQQPDRAVFATYEDLADVLKFYREALVSLGWHEVRTWMTRPTDGVAGPGMVVSAFCQGVDQPALLVAVVSTESGPNELRLLLDGDRQGPCSSSGTPDPWNGQAPPVF